MGVSKLYDIKEAARYLGIAPSKLRYWEKMGLVRAERNTTNDYRQYALHHLIDISEIAFYRKIGVSVKELQNYYTMTTEEFQSTLERTGEDIEQRIAELQMMKARLSHQQSLNARAAQLREEGMRVQQPNLNLLSAIDYDNMSLWKAFTDEPWRYGVFVSAATPSLVQEAVVDAPWLDTDVVWEKSECLAAQDESYSCLLKVNFDTELSDAEQLFNQARALGMDPTHMVGTYLLSASEQHDGSRWDYYQAWILP